MLRSVVLGLFQGAIYGLLAAGLVLVYRATRTLNLAQTEFGSVGAFVAFGLIEHAGFPYAAAGLLGVGAAVAVGLVAERVAVRPLAGEAGGRTLATVGVALLMVAAVALVAKPEARTLPPAAGGDPVSLGGAVVTPHHLVAAGVAVGLVLALHLLLRRTGAGLAIRAAGEDPTGALVSGVSPGSVSRAVWVVSAALGGVAGLLQAPLGAGFAPGFLTVAALVPALAAALASGMGSLRLAFAAGVGVGVVQAAGVAALGDGLHVPGAPQLSVFLILLAVLLVRPVALEDRGA